MWLYYNCLYTLIQLQVQTDRYANNTLRIKHRFLITQTDDQGLQPCESTRVRHESLVVLRQVYYA